MGIYQASTESSNDIVVLVQFRILNNAIGQNPRADMELIT